MHLRTDNKGDAGKSIVADADKLLKEIRQGAVKAIHAASKCTKDDDEDATEQDNDENDDEDKDEDSSKKSSKNEGNLLVVFFNNLFGNNRTQTVTTNTTTTTTTATGDAKTIADNAVAAMKLVFDTAKSDLEKAATSATPRPAKSPEHSDKKSDHKGKGNSDDREDDDD